MQEIGFKPRRLEYRAKQALRLLGNIQGAPLTHAQLRAEAGDEVKQTRQGISVANLYGPNDLRKVREKLDPMLMDALRNPIYNGLPPIIVGHVTKGGTGKTSVTVNEAVALAAQGYKVLLIDADPQGSASETLGVDTSHEALKTLRDVMAPEKATDELQDVVISIYENATLHLIPADNKLTRLDREISMVRNPDKQFFNLLSKNTEFFKQYDFVLIDTAPSSSSLNFNMMVAATMILCIVSLDGSTLKALDTLEMDIGDINDLLGSQPPFMLVPNKFHNGEKHCVTNLDFLRNRYERVMCEHVVPVYTGFARQVKVWDVQSSRPLFEDEPSAPACEVMLDISRVLIKRLVEEPAAALRKAQQKQDGATPVALAA
jgi:chromosome partitioning protein